ncbi:MAG: diguanylate cyclase domain-containing protein, partial [Oscillospiraceae bacterium]
GKIAQEIIDVLGKGFISDSTGEKLSIKCSIGIAFLRESGKTTDEIVAAADEAMYNIKKHGKSAYAYAKSAPKPDSTAAQHTPSTTSTIDSDKKPEVITADDIETHNLFDPLS